MRPVTSVCVLMILAFCHITAGSDYFCQNNRVVNIRGTTEGRIFTRESGSRKYAANLHCTWIIEADRSMNDVAINIKVATSDLDWAPDGMECAGYDYIRIRDGSTSSARTLLTWCGNMNPYSLTSTGSALYIEFFSDSQSQSSGSGVELTFVVFERRFTLGGCPPGWSDNPNYPNGGSTCYKLSTQKATWVMAQTFCSYDQSNLVSVSSTEQSFIVDMISKYLDFRDKVWISLNDLFVRGRYRWLDGRQLTFSRWNNPNQKQISSGACVSMDINGYWQADACNGVQYRFICEKSKVGTTTIYSIPATAQSLLGMKSPASSSKTGLIIGVVIGLILLVIIVVIILICCLRRRRQRRERGALAGVKYGAKDDIEVKDQDRLNELAASLHKQAPSKERPERSAPPAEQAESSQQPQQQPQTVVVVVQQPSHPTDPPPSYKEATAV